MSNVIFPMDKCFLAPMAGTVEPRSSKPMGEPTRNAISPTAKCSLVPTVGTVAMQ